ncbi:MAG: aldo/keto reductase [Candidatus Hydrogenedentota bacterium]
MERRTLGTTELEVTPIGLGCWQFSNRVGLAGKFWPALGESVTREIVRVTLAGGINWFDTAEIYGKGASEKRLADGLSNARVPAGEVVVATKWHPLFRFAGHMLKTIGERKDCLRPYAIDLYQVHIPFSFSTIKREAAALAQLVKEGHVRAVGVSNYSARQMIAMHGCLAEHGVPLASNQVEYSLLKRRVETNDILEAAKERGISIIAYSPLAQGILSGKFHKDPALCRGAGLRRLSPLFRKRGMATSRPVVTALDTIAERYEATAAQVALNWVINFHGGRVLAIPGATKPSQAQQNTGAMAFTLKPEELAQLDELTRGFR